MYSPYFAKISFCIIAEFTEKCKDKLCKRKKRERGDAFPFRIVIYASMPREARYFLTISATLKVIASSNSRKSRPVSFLIFSRR